MKKLKYVLCIVFMTITFSSFSQSQSEDPNAVITEWEAISMGKLQKKPRFKEPMISVRFMSENGIQYMNLGLKYMFTDAVFEDAVPVEYYKDEKIEFVTNKGKVELKAAKYAKARRMNAVAQKTADLKVLFVGDLSFLKDDLTEKVVVHFAQGYQNVDINNEESVKLRQIYNKFVAMLPATPDPVSKAPQAKARVEPKIEVPAEPVILTPVEDSQSSLEKLRKQAKKWK